MRYRKVKPRIRRNRGQWWCECTWDDHTYIGIADTLAEAYHNWWRLEP